MGEVKQERGSTVLEPTCGAIGWGSLCPFALLLSFKFQQCNHQDVAIE